jgi:CO/xanthine dehydrogenase Mo-binding subunit
LGRSDVDLEVDPETGRVTILRYTVAQDAGRAIHPSYVEGHPYGVRGVGETPIVPPLAAVANAMEGATGIRFTELPMSPPKVLKALKERGLNKA